MASEHPCPHEEGSAHRQPLRSSDGPGAWRQVSVPHIWDQPHPLLQLPRRGHAGERRAVRAEDGSGNMSRHYCQVIPFVRCFWDDTFRVEQKGNNKTVVVGLSPFLHVVKRCDTCFTSRKKKNWLQGLSSWAIGGVELGCMTGFCLYQIRLRRRDCC